MTVISPDLPGRCPSPNHGNRSTSNRMRMRMVRHLPTLSIAMSVTSLALILAQPATAETVTHRHRHAGHHDQHGDRRRRHPPASSPRKVSAEGRQIRQHQVRARVAELHVRSARHQRDDGEQAADRHDGRLSADRERLHLRQQSREQEPPDRASPPTACPAPATASSFTRTRPTTISPISRASSSACPSAPPRTAWC